MHQVSRAGPLILATSNTGGHKPHWPFSFSPQREEREGLYLLTVCHTIRKQTALVFPTNKIPKFWKSLSSATANTPGISKHQVLICLRSHWKLFSLHSQHSNSCCSSVYTQDTKYRYEGLNFRTVYTWSEFTTSKMLLTQHQTNHTRAPIAQQASTSSLKWRVLGAERKKAQINPSCLLQ